MPNLLIICLNTKLQKRIIPQEIEEKIQIRGRAAKVDIVDRTGVMLATEKQFSAFEGVSKLLSTGGGDEFEFPDEIKPRLLTPRGNACVVQIVSSAGKKCRVELGDANTVFELYCHTMKLFLQILMNDFYLR